MGWKVDSTQAVDEGLRQRLTEKIERGAFEAEDLQDFFTLFTQLANDMDETRDEVDGFDRKFQFKLEGYGNVYLAIKDGKFEMGLGDIGAPDITLEMSAKLAAGMFTGLLDATAAYMNGEFKIDGNLPDAIKFGALIELVYTELDLSPSESPFSSGQTTATSPRADGLPAPRKGTKQVKFGVIGAGSVWDFHRAACAGSPLSEICGGI